MTFIVIFALVFYIAQFIFFHNNCDVLNTLPEVCVKSGNWLVFTNAAYTLVDALCYGLILFMTYKFLI